MELSVLAIDLAKSVFQLHGADARGKQVLSKKLRRSQLSTFIARARPCTIAMEACSGAHFWARQFGEFGHTMKLIAPQFVKPYVKSNKNDRADAAAICEAAQRPDMRFVSIKTIEQQEIQNLHRVRQRVVTERTALINQTRGLLTEHGLVLPQGSGEVLKRLHDVVAKGVEQGLMTEMGRKTFEDLGSELVQAEERIDRLDKRILAIHKAHPVSQRLAEVPGVGPITATAVMAAVGDPHVFKNGRQCAAWLGLVPRQHSSGGKERLLGISKRGDSYLRQLLVHGARSEIRWLDRRSETRQTLWLRNLIVRRGMNRAVVALANKNARRLWVLMARQVDYDAAA